jgi:hypothetical protein
MASVSMRVSRKGRRENRRAHSPEPTVWHAPFPQWTDCRRHPPGGIATPTPTNEPPTWLGDLPQPRSRDSATSARCARWSGGGRACITA